MSNAKFAQVRSANPSARQLYFSAAPAFTTAITVRENWRGREVVTAAGIVVPLAALVVEAGRAVAGAGGAGDAGGLTGARALVLLAAVGFGLLGAVDDLLGHGDARGFRGHVASLLRGRLTRIRGT